MAHSNYYHSNMNGRMSMSSEAPRISAEENNTLWKVALVVALTYLVWSDKVAIVFNPGEKFTRSESALPAAQRTHAQASVLGLTTGDSRPVQSKPRNTRVRMPENALNNVTPAIDPDFAGRNGLPEKKVLTCLEHCKDYIERFAPVAMAEQKKFGIPASITLAQGLLESNAGASKLARTTNNHFGIKCFSKSCKKGHCVNFSDDSHKDFFVSYTNVWSSFRAHSKFLKNTARYAKLFQLASDDYRSWAQGLQKAGYATDARYGEKLIAIIENLELDRYDRE